MADISKTLSDMVFVAHHDACYDVVEDDDLISNWEIIDPSDDDDEDEIDYCFDDVDDDDSEDLLHQNDVDVDVVEDVDGGGGLVISSSVLSSKLISDHPITFHGGGVHAYALDVVEREKYESDDEEEVDDEDEYDDDDDQYDLDDELVPKCMSDRFGRERMRKLGKRAYPKMNKSKRLGYSYNRPGCVYGKHGLGLKHSI